MKVFLLLVSIVVLPASSFGENNFGAGIVLGSPTGLTAKYIFDKSSAIDSALSFGRGSNFYLHSTWLWHKPEFFNIKKHPVFWYFGIGPRLINYDNQYDYYYGPYYYYRDDRKDELHVAMRVPVGVRMQFIDPRIEIFTEISLSLDVIPEMDTDLDFGLGARYYF